MTPRKLLVNLDVTLCATAVTGHGYLDHAPLPAVVAQLARFRAAGYQITLFTSRQMGTYAGQLATVNRYSAQATVKWLRRYRVPYDRLLFGRPWAVRDATVVDGRDVTAADFLTWQPVDPVGV